MKLMKVINENKTVIIITFIILCIALTGTYIYYIAKASNEISADFVAIGDLNDEVVEATKQKRNLSEEASNLNSQYKDVKAWLRIPGTVIDTPVFQSSDNERYYRNNRDNEETKWGEIYLDYRCDLNNMDKQHYIIYGHNTEANNNLSPILNYKSKNFLKKHNIIEISTLEGNYRFEVFSTYTTDTSFFYLDIDFKDSNEYKSFLKNISSKSTYYTGNVVNENDTILTLSTCDYTIKDGRYVVHAKLIK